MNFIKKLKIILQLFKPFKLQMLLLIIVMSVSGFFESLNLAALYPVINYGLEQKSGGIISNIFDRSMKFLSNDNPFLTSCVILIIITVITVGFKAFTYFFSYKFTMNSMSMCYQKVFGKYINADYNFFVKNKHGKLLHTGSVAVDQTAYLILLVITTLTDFLSLLLMLSLLMLLTWQGTILILIIGFIYLVAVKRTTSGVVYKSGRLQVEADREKSVILNEMIMGIKSIRVFRVSGEWKKKYYDKVDKALHNLFKMMMGRTLPELLNRLIFFVVIAGLGIFVGIRDGGNVVSWIPMLGTFAIVASRLLQVSQKMGNGIMRIAGKLHNAEIVVNLLSEETNKLIDGTIELGRFSNVISFDNIWYRYEGTDSFIFKGLDLKIKKMKVTAIVGPSGSGKTTTVNLLLRLYSPDKGSITLDGIDIAKYAHKSYLSKIAYVSQESFILHDTIRENIRFGIAECDEDRVVEAAKQASSHEFIMNTPEGYSTIVGDAGIKLSGGQRQRIAIARAMLRKPEIMILDEATSSLDNISEKVVQQAINNISQYTTVIVVAHRLSTIINADKIIVLSDGIIAEEGTHVELLEKRGTYFNLYNVQTKDQDIVNTESQG